MNNIEYEVVVKGANVRPYLGSFGFSTCVLLKDGNDLVLFDTGSFGVRNTITDLREKYKITKLVLSHLHFDHCANIDLFEDIPVYVAKDELTSLNSDSDYNTYTTLKYIKDRFNFVFLQHEQKITKNIIAFHTPGHTLGHFSLGFNHNDKKYIAAGDAIKSLKEYVSDYCVVAPVNPEQYQKSKEFIKNNFDYIIPGHQDIFCKENLSEYKIELTTF